MVSLALEAVLLLILDLNQVPAQRQPRPQNLPHPLQRAQLHLTAAALPAYYLEEDLEVLLSLEVPRALSILESKLSVFLLLVWAHSFSLSKLISRLVSIAVVCFAF